MRNKRWVLFFTILFLAAMSVPALAATMIQGRPASIDTSTSAGYYIWQEGNRWHVRTVNAGMQRLFTGMVETDGTFSDVSTQPSEKVERVAVNVRSEKIEFHFNSLAKSDGFSFTIQNSQNAKFTLYLDGLPIEPSSIHLGRQNRHPDSHTFTIGATGGSVNNLSRFQGQPTTLAPGKILGYFIWQDGDRWFLRTTTRGAQRQFSGTIRTNGSFNGVSRNNLEDNDLAWVNDAGNEISFNMKTGGDLDGLSFQLGSGADATFTLNLDGQPVNVSNIYLGSQNLRPTNNPFSLNSAEGQYVPNDSRNLPSDDRPVLFSDVQGQPTALTPGGVFGYFIWQDQNRWILQTTTTGSEKQFTGTIETNGTISDVKTLRSLRTDGAVVDATGSKVSFAFKTGGSASGISISIGEGIRLNQPDKVSGLSFLVTEGATLTFSLYADGQPVDPASIYLGSSNRHPSASEVKILSRNR